MYTNALGRSYAHLFQCYSNLESYVHTIESYQRPLDIHTQTSREQLLEEL